MNATAPACPSCRQAMFPQQFPRKLGGVVALDLCIACQGIWFDEFESLQLAPAGIVELFRLILAQPEGQRLPLAASLYCPRCNERLIHLQDMVRSGRFNYLRCAQHGRFISFGQFMIEKGFVRQLAPAEIKELTPRVALLRCNSCGAPVDIRKESACVHCRSPIVVLDADAVEKALAGYLGGAGARPAAERSRSPAAWGAPRRHAARDPATAPDLVDLVAEGVAGLSHWVGD